MTKWHLDICIDVVLIRDLFHSAVHLLRGGELAGDGARQQLVRRVAARMDTLRCRSLMFDDVRIAEVSDILLALFVVK